MNTNTAQRKSIAHLQKQIIKELHMFQNRKSYSLKSLKNQRTNSNGINAKSILIEDSHKERKNKSLKSKSNTSLNELKVQKLGRSYDQQLVKSSKNKFGKLKKKTTLAFDKQFTTLSRKNSQPTNAGSIPSFNSLTDMEMGRLLEKNQQYEQKIKRQMSLISKLEDIIGQMAK